MDCSAADACLPHRRRHVATVSATPSLAAGESTVPLSTSLRDGGRDLAWYLCTDKLGAASGTREYSCLLLRGSDILVKVLFLHAAESARKDHLFLAVAVVAVVHATMVGPLCERVVRCREKRRRRHLAIAQDAYPERSYYGGPEHECPHCGAVFWFQERVKSLSHVAQRKIVYFDADDSDETKRKLSDQIVVDAYSTIEGSRLKFIADHQKELRSESVQGIADAIDRGLISADSVGFRVIVPPSFTGGRRYHVMNYQDAMAICRVYGPPDLFVTFTCNTKWREIVDALRFEPGQQPCDRSDLIVRVFHMKVDEFIADIREGRTFGPILAVLYTVEFQKRGLPHIHCLVWLADGSKEFSASVVDKFICAEIPDVNTDSLGYALVDEFMMHGPCGDDNKKCPCMKDNKCSKNFPKSFQDETIVDDFGFTIYKRRDDGRRVVKNGIALDNRNVVPYNMHLLKKYNAHINVEWCNKSNMIKYLFKYVTKGSDRARLYFEVIAKTSNGSPGPQLAPPNEIQEYIDARYLSSCEALWRAFEYDIHFRVPPVERLSVHLPGLNHVRYEPGANLEALLASPAAKSTMLTEWFEANSKHEEARHLTYWLYFTDDMCRRLRDALGNPNYIIPHEQIMSLLIQNLTNVFANSGGNINDYDLPRLAEYSVIMCENRLINDELDPEPLALSMHAASLVAQLNDDQRNVYDMITGRVLSGSSGFFFVCGHGGTASRAIVCPNNVTVDEINDYVVSLLPGDSVHYFSCDTISKSSEHIPDFDVLYPTEFLNSIDANNFPSHKLVLKKGATVMLLRNLNQNMGLCNGTRLLVTQLGQRLLQCVLLTGSNVGEVVFIPRIALNTTDVKWPFTLQRRQFPVRICYAMTINKSQGQTLSRVGLYLKKPVFTHGQFYVAVSRSTSRSGLRILIENDDGSCGSQTRNVVYQEVLAAAEAMGDVLIPELKHGSRGETICVRISRFWDFFDTQDETKLLHSDMVLIDEEGNSIHAQLYPPLPGKFNHKIKEGSVYNLSCFWVKKANRMYKPVSNENMISFTDWTVLEEVVEIPPAFPMFAYSLTPIEQIHSRVGYKEYYTDAIGVVTSVSSVFSQRYKGQQNASLKRTISICNASNASVNVVLWGEQATLFPGEQICKDGQAIPQIVLFVGTLVKRYADGLCLSGGSPCKWYIYPDVPEAKVLMASARSTHKPVKWNEIVSSSQPGAHVAEEQKVSYIKHLHPFETKVISGFSMSTKKEFLVTVTIKKINNKWWYNSCKKCTRTAKPHGDSYKCIDDDCGTIGVPTQRYRLFVTAGDETGDTDFILFGRIAQRLVRRPADALIADTPAGFIPDAITKLLERAFTWNVSFTENTIVSGNVCFQVNAVICEMDTGNALIPMSPGGSQQSSLMLSQGASSSVQNTPQKGATMILPPPLTPQGGKANTADKVTPHKSDDPVLTSSGTTLEPMKVPYGPAALPEVCKDNDAANVPEIDADSKDITSAPAGSSTTKAQKNTVGKRQATAKKLFLDKDDASTAILGCADAAAEPSVSEDA
ncbi:hypothetical protein U9M48_029572 [Paspalum notatum var. saurae]|uniref:ATP-dependent DNA helicase n=1 Tax=Paspalum notatum var. saurae TaxID=547442 RepID=A0AAQ3U3M1_PASNO